ncbi:uncharacterized protein STEHIDRAFT_150518 [Stereum hirsutum FP-91666 SS1]|uniref:uncharacterized protein n=1 Tax=Stereum hirsutum (strain FP-91666) TaxID=721885 RepID=UPI000444A127|nr:uncharacterized protein STEHIDRAFT_150518 [Stereum hirsutum FP-91666 SS1]EIM80903.1 hypothetical protein STEHIDRAFT_150518 [Stereum hirsutum FP-91666 SS1]
MRARMVLRKKGQEVTDVLIKREMAHPSMAALSQQDVLYAMDRDDEILNIILLVPLGHDERTDMERRSIGVKSTSPSPHGGPVRHSKLLVHNWLYG